MTNTCRHPELTRTAEGKKCVSCGLLIYLPPKPQPRKKVTNRCPSA